jgi:hypothetical protein
VRPATARTTAFGLDVYASPAPGVLAGALAWPTSRWLELRLDLRPSPADGWPSDARRVGIQHDKHGHERFTVSAHERAGYRLAGDGYGEHVLSRDGLRLRCAPHGAHDHDWQRFLIAQVLPFAAAVRGLEVLHAGAVVIGGRALLLLGASGAGKTTLALALTRLGAGFLADDAVALERSGERLLAHPGTPVAAVGRGQAERLLGIPTVPAPAPLGAVLCLERSADGPDVPCFEPLGDGAPLLASTFNLMLRDGERMGSLLEVCALAARERVERVTAGPGVDPAALAGAVMERLCAVW